MHHEASTQREEKVVGTRRKPSFTRSRRQIELSPRWQRELQKWQQSGSIKLFSLEVENGEKR
jgi:hypothetical protein